MEAREAAVIGLLAGILTLLIYSTFGVFFLVHHVLESSRGKNAAWSRSALGPWIRFKKRRLTLPKRIERRDSRNRYWWTSTFLGSFLGVWEWEVQLPVIFLTSPQNTRRPAGDLRIWHVDGSLQYMQDPVDTHTAAHDAYSASEEEEPINLGAEAASWLNLLKAVESMELQSKGWERSTWERSYSPFLEGSEERRLVVAFQQKTYVLRKNSRFRKPYAITTLADVIELAAVLGIYWKIFDREHDIFRADGSGFCLYGWRETSLGLCFKFEQVGQAKFMSNRVIPTISIRPLCFGMVPTIWSERDTWGYGESEKQGGESVILGRLRLDSRSAIANTLRLVGCDTETISSLEENNRCYQRLFPVAFELMGMLGQTMHVINRPFTYIPNPTMHIWNRRLCSFRKLLEEFFSWKTSLDGLMGDTLSSGLSHIFHLVEMIEVELSKKHPKEPYTPEQLDSLHKAISRTDDILTQGEDRRLLVLDVLRQHLHALAHKRDFAILFKGAVEEKERRFMGVYFDIILPKASASEDNTNPTRVLVWCALVFRMICWFLLHNIAEGDVQLPKGDLLGSRIPAYIE
ncbi:hypothetical protein DER44DRAFT_739035 [Fusarium oxysporum]|nr:hypothetical protein DER44DRAFT_739035 [Fusarium oxysporum]